MNMTMVVCKVLLSAALVVFNAATDFSGGPTTCRAKLAAAN